MSNWADYWNRYGRPRDESRLFHNLARWEHFRIDGATKPIKPATALAYVPMTGYCAKERTN